MEATSAARPAAVFALFGGLVSSTLHQLGFRVVLLRALRFPPKNFLISFRKILKQIFE